MIIPAPFLVGGPVLITIAAGASYLLVRTGGEDKALAARIAAVTEHGRPKIAVAMPSITRKDTQVRQGWREALCSLIGFQPARKDQYSIGWIWVVLTGAALGRGAVSLGAGMLGWLAWLLFPLVAIGFCRAIFGGMITKRIDRLRVQLPDALGLIVRAVRVGIPVSEALRAVARESTAPTALEFDRLADQIAIGTPMDAALRQMSERNQLPEYGFFAAALTLQAQTGGGLAETLELLADVTRKRVAMKARGHALSAEARTSSLVLGGLPFVTSIGLYVMAPDYIGVLFKDPTGHTVLGGALLLLALGAFAMRTIIRKSLS